MTCARIVTPSQRPAPNRVAGFDIQALISGDEAQAFEAPYTSGNNGTGPAPHCHPWDETFFVIRGPVVFGLVHQEQPIEAGTLLHVPGGERHWWRFEVEGELLSFTSGKQAAAMYQDLATLRPCEPMPPSRSIGPWPFATASRHGPPAHS
jgi:quercetin dioxygenase-like cupin family protein